MHDITVVASCFAGFWFLFVNGTAFFALRRSLKTRQWKQTAGKIISFDPGLEIPEIVYCYTVDGVDFEGRAIVPAVSKRFAAKVKPPKSAYFHPDRGLIFEAGREVPVYFDPLDPEDAVLVRESGEGLWRLLLVGTGIPAGIVFLASGNPWVFAHKTDLFAAAFGLIGILLAGVALKWAIRYRRSAGFPSVPGRILKSEIVYVRSDRGGAHQVELEFEYAVGEQLYRSNHQSDLPVRVGRSQSKAEALAKRWREEPLVNVIHDPTEPWRGFLERGPLFGVFMMGAMALAFGGFALLVMIKAGQ